MTDKRTECAVPGCGGAASDQHPFCSPHYAQLLPPAKKALKYAHRAKDGDDEGAADRRVDDAIAKAVEELKRPPAWF
jgi:hypothetical protein